MATLRDVARKAGVSISTVSHVFNGYDDIPAETRKRVWDAARELDYHPNASARSLVSRRSNLLGLVVPGRAGMRHPFLYAVICGVAEAIAGTRFGLTLSVAEDDQRSLREQVNRWKEQRLEGLIAMGFAEDHPVAQAILESGIPAMLVDTILESPRVSWVKSNDTEGAAQAVRHLLSLGHRRIAYIHGLGGQICQERLDGYRLALSEAGIPFDPQLVEVADFTKSGGYRAMNRILSRANPTAVFAASDLMAFGAMECLRDRGLRLPEDMAIVGFDDIDAASHVTPALTTVRQFGDRMGKEAAETLVAFLEGRIEKPHPSLVGTELVIRRSCGYSAKPYSMMA
ncbi:MAG: LacI family DNA-binding transcriptional regulator [Limnochordales bacterium]|nr:LacI family DNA-binding transcriptional regulator [Limnochordales bacterium]